MKKSYKSILTLGIALSLSASFTLVSFAGWEQTGATWKYQNTDKTYLTNSWNWIDGNNDGVSECYYFNADGIMAVNTLIEGYTVNEQGAWTVNGIVQTKPAPKQDTQQSVPQPTQPAPQPTQPIPEPVVQETQPAETSGLGELAPGALSREEIERRKAAAGLTGSPDVEIITGGDGHTTGTVGDPVPIG